MHQPMTSGDMVFDSVELKPHGLSFWKASVRTSISYASLQLFSATSLIMGLLGYLGGSS